MAENEANQGGDRPGDGASQHDLQSEVEALKADLQKLQGDISGIAQSIMGVGRSQAEDARERAQQQWEEGMNRFQQYVEQRPLATVATAFIVGLLAGKLFGK